MDDRYKVKVYEGKDKYRGNRVSTLYGVWDKKLNQWVLNTTGVDKNTAQRYLNALRKR